MQEIRIRLMGAVLLLAVIATASAASGADVSTSELPTIVGLVTAGQFREAGVRIDAALRQPGIPARRWRRSNSSASACIAFNDDFAQAFMPPKQYFRSDDVDSQRGDVESDGKLYYDKWSYHFDWRILRGVAPGQE